jgi:hypothetical protein
MVEFGKGWASRRRKPPDVNSPRAKSQVHGKVTADKWNQ